MEQKTVDALRWIVGILDKHGLEYQIAGGCAAKLYGSRRPLNDIDIDIRDEAFHVIFAEVSEYLTYGPMRFNDGKFDCLLMTLEYGGQEIDLSGADTLRMTNKERTEWITYPDFVFRTLDIPVAEFTVKVLHPHELAEYKKELDGEHQQEDVRAAEAYAVARGL